MNIKAIMKNLCLIALGANIVVMGFAWTFASTQLFLLGGSSAVLVLFGYLYGYPEDQKPEE